MPSSQEVLRSSEEQMSSYNPIGDFSENGINSCFGSVERVDLRALDELVWSSMVLMRSLSSGSVNIPGSKFESGSELHEYWLRWPCKGVPKLKTLDLKSAYKQLPLMLAEVSKANICLKCPRDNDVYGFPYSNPFARYLQRVFWHLSIVSANYFDDNPIVEMAQLCSSTESTMRAVVNLLGIEISEDKEQSFNGSAETLCVSVDVSSEALDAVRVSNRKDRVEDIGGALQRMLWEGKVHVKDCSSRRLRFRVVVVEIGFGTPEVSGKAECKYNAFGLVGFCFIGATMRGGPAEHLGASFLRRSSRDGARVAKDTSWAKWR